MWCTRPAFRSYVGQENSCTHFKALLLFHCLASVLVIFFSFGQIARKAGHSLSVAPLQPTPVRKAPFSRVPIDCVGPLPKTKKGNEYLLTIKDFVAHFPQAVPLQKIHARSVIEPLLYFSS